MRADLRNYSGDGMRRGVHKKKKQKEKSECRQRERNLTSCEVRERDVN